MSKEFSSQEYWSGVPFPTQDSALKRKENITHVTTWINLEDIMLSEINQSQKDQYSVNPLV